MHPARVLYRIVHVHMRSNYIDNSHLTGKQSQANSNVHLSVQAAALSRARQRRRSYF